MNRTFARGTLILAALALPSLPQTNPVRHTVIATVGDVSPTGGHYLGFSFQNASLNARQAVAFDAAITGTPFTTAVFVGDGTTTSTIALGIDPRFGLVTNPFLTNNGEVVFDNNSSEVFRSFAGTITPLARLGDPVPGGGTVAFLGPRAVNDFGAIAYVAGLNGTKATQALLRTDGTRTTTIARDDMPPPTGGSFTSLLNLDVNEVGQVAFKSEMTGGSADFGIFRGEGGPLTPVFVTGQVTHEGARFLDFGLPAINARGQVMTVCLLTNSASRAGLFVGDGTDTVAIALNGQPAPKGGNYDVFLGTPKLNDRGEVAFLSQFVDGASGLFRGDGKRITTLALTGTSAPGTTGTFQSFGDFLKFGNDGRVVFAAKLAVGVGGVTFANNIGIWAGTSDQDLQLVVRTGETIAGKLLTDISLTGFGTGNKSQEMNGNSLLWRGAFGAAKTLVLSRIPGQAE